MKIDVDFTALHIAASRMKGPKSFTVGEAFEAGVSSLRDGPTPDNCHYSIFESDHLRSEWDRGRVEARRLAASI